MQIAAVTAAVGIVATSWALYGWAVAKRDLETSRRIHSDYVAAQITAQAEAQRKARLEEERRRAEHEQITKDAAERTRQAQADAARASVAAGKLRSHIAALAAACGASADPPPPGGSAPASGPGLVLADLFGRADDRAGELARYADAAREAGRACERAYEALRR